MKILADLNTKLETKVENKLRFIFINWVLAVLCFISLIANGYTNSWDGLWESSDFRAGNWEISLGRWGWYLFDKTRGGYAADPFNSLLTLLLLTIGACILVGLFHEIKIKDYLLVQLILISTSTGGFLSYRFMAPTFGLSLIAAVVAVWLLMQNYEEKNQKITVYILATLSLAFCLGLYQPSLGYFCVLILFLFMKYLIEEEDKKGYALFIKGVIIAGCSCIVYKLVWDITLKIRHISAADYNGANSLSIGKIILSIPSGIVRAYYSWIRFFVLYDSHYIFEIGRIILCTVVVILVVALGVMRLRKTPGKLALYLLAFACVPIGANIAFLLAPGEYGLMIQMTGALATLLSAKLCLLEGDEFKFSRIIPFIAAILLYGNIYAVGTDLDAMAQGNTAMRSVMNNVVATMTNEGVCDKDLKYAFVGDISANELFKTNNLWYVASAYAQAGKFWTKADCILKSYGGLLDDMGLSLKLVEIDEYEDILASDYITSMPVYPEKGSIVEKNGVIVIKISNEIE